MMRVNAFRHYSQAQCTAPCWLLICDVAQELLELIELGGVLPALIEMRRILPIVCPSTKQLLAQACKDRTFCKIRSHKGGGEVFEAGRHFV